MSTLPTKSTVVPDETGQDQASTSSAQHSRSSSVQSTATDFEKDDKVPDIVRRDMEFFMARLTRTTSNDSTASR